MTLSSSRSFVTPLCAQEALALSVPLHHVAVSAITSSQASPAPVSPCPYPLIQAAGQAFVLLVFEAPVLGTESGRFVHT